MTVCLFAGPGTNYLEEPLDEATTLERVSAYVRSLPDVERIVVFASVRIAGVPPDWEWRLESDWDGQMFMNAIGELVTGPDSVILFTYLDQPFLNRELTVRLIDRHEQFKADYTFADGYPVGLAPELLRGRALGYLRDLANDAGPVRRDTLFSIVQKDMNRFDVETELSRTDQRLLRLCLAVDNRANLEVCRSLATSAPESIDAWPEYVETLRHAHRSLPRYVNVQVLEQDVHEVAYSPYPVVAGSVLSPGAVMAANRFEQLVDDLHAFSPEAVVAISLWGEVSLHPDVSRLIEAVAKRAPLGLIVETSGVGWRAEDRDALFAQDRVSVIVGLDTNDQILYRDLRGEGYDEAMQFANEAVEAMPGRAYVQAVRCDLTEPTLESFYKEWKAKTDNVIIQKYDWWCGILPDRRVGDLAPLGRFPCWHLQRDLTVLVDGVVPLCREDLQRTRELGNVFDTGIAGVWRQGEEPYAEHIAGSYRGICEKCDEYYTFNF